MATELNFLSSDNMFARLQAKDIENEHRCHHLYIDRSQALSERRELPPQMKNLGT